MDEFFPSTLLLSDPSSISHSNPTAEARVPTLDSSPSFLPSSESCHNPSIIHESVSFPRTSPEELTVSTLTDESNGFNHLDDMSPQPPLPPANQAVSNGEELAGWDAVHPTEKNLLIDVARAKNERVSVKSDTSHEVMDLKDQNLISSKEHHTRKDLPVSKSQQKPMTLPITVHSPLSSRPHPTTYTLPIYDDTSDQSPETSIYQIKWTTFGPDDLPCPIVTQNRNGPCPLISIFNALLLTRRIQLQPNIEYQSGENLMSQLASMILESIPNKVADEVLRNFEQNIQDALAILPKLQTGLDINVRFSGPRQYEFTQDTLVFDVLDVPLVHGWIVDAEDTAKRVLDKCGSYNHLVEFIINSKQSNSDFEAILLAEDWLERTRSQLTYAGLVSLVECLQSDIPCVLFRNNHFTTIVKHNEQIYALITDQGYATEASCVWEQISNIEGDTDFFDAKFSLRASKEPASSPHGVVLDPQQQLELDLQLAMSLQEENEREELPVDDPVMSKRNVESKAAAGVSDFELAKQLQAEEEAMARANTSKVNSPAKPSAGVSSSQSVQILAHRDVDVRRNASPYHPNTDQSSSVTGNDLRRRSPSAASAPPSNPNPPRTSSTMTFPSSRQQPRPSTATTGEKNKNCIIS